MTKLATTRPPRGATLMFRVTALAMVVHGAVSLHCVSDAQEAAPREQAAQPGTPATGGLSIEIRVLGPDGKPTDRAAVCLWCLLKTGEEVEPPFPWQKNVYWHDRRSGKTWRVRGGHSTDWKTAFRYLAPGEYRVTAVGDKGDYHRGATPIGVSEIIRLDGRVERTTVTVRQEGNCPLTVKVTYATTGRPVKYASLLLVRADGLPVGYGSEGFPACTDGEGLKRYGKLVPGTYWLHNVELRASQYGQVDYQAPSRRIRVKVAPGRDNVVEVPLHAVQREQDEIKRRWPFIATGRATDGQGRPVAGVEVRACCGVGTLWPTGKCFTEKDGRYTLRF